jgi:Skp family chaperone for outer membrane proteins
MGDNDQVPGTGEGVGENPTPDAPEQSGVAQPATPVQNPPADVEKKLKAEYEEKLTRYQTDLNQMKSSLQRREAQVNADWQKRYDGLQNQMHEVRMSKMTEEEREAYEAQLQNEEMRTLQQQLAELQTERQTMAQSMEAMSFFLQQGVPAKALVLNEGYDMLVRSGWDNITNELNTLRQSRVNPQPQPKPEPLPQAPSVITDKATPASGTTWAALRQRYGSDEAIYRAVEEGRLPPSVIPTG